MIHILELREKTSEKKLAPIIMESRLLHFFTADTSQWDKTKAIKWIISRVLLSIVVLGLGIYTLKTASILIMDYASSPTSFTQTTLFNESISLPQSIVCLPLASYELDDYWSGLKKNSHLRNTFHYQQMIIQFFEDETLTKEALLAEDNEWPNYLLFVAHHYLNFTMQFEALSGQTVIQDYYLSFIAEFGALYGNKAINKPNAMNNTYNDIMTSLNILDEKMAGLNISAADLKLKYGSEIKSLFNLTTTYWKYLSDYTAVAFDNSVFSSFEQGCICFIVRFDQHPLKRKDSVWIRAERSELPNPRPDYGFQMAIGVGGRLFDRQYEEHWIVPFDSWIHSIPLQVTSTFRSIPSIGGKIRCSENKSFDVCINECWMGYFRERCGCIPISGYSESIFNKPACNLQLYTNCFGKGSMRSEKAQDHINQCENNCLDVCNRTTYFSPKDSQYSYEYGQKEDTAIIELSIASFDYPVFEETLKWTLPSFIGVLGGAFGLWVGINILDTVVYAAVGVNILTKAKKRKIADKNIVNSPSKLTNYSTITAARNIFRYCNKISKQIFSIKLIDLFLRISLGLLALVVIGMAQREYFKQPTTTTVNVEYNESRTLPPATICLPLQLGELDKYYKSTIWNSNYASALTQYLKEKKITKDDLMPTNKRWNNAVRRVAHAYLIKFAYCELGFECNSIYTEDKDLVSSMNIFEAVISQLNISIDELHQKLGDEVAALYSFKVSLYDFNQWKEDIDSIRTNLFGDNQICYTIPFNLYPLKVTSYYYISVSEYTLPSPMKYGRERSLISIDFKNRLYFKITMTDSYLMTYFAEYKTYMVELTMYRTLEKLKSGERRCSDQTIEECEAICQIKAVQTQCQCAPISWLSLLKHLNYTVSDVCDMRKYKKCLNEDGSEFVEECSHMCLRPCERLTVTSRDFTSQPSNKKTGMYIYLDNLNMITFDEQLAWSFEGLLRKIGGIVGFLLGYSIFDVTCLTFLLFMRLCMAHLERSKGILRRNRQIRITEVGPAPKISANCPEEISDNSVHANRHSNFVDKFNKIGWKVDNIQWMTEHIFKLIAIVYFSYLTANMCVPIIQNFKEGKTVYQINLALNEPIYLKPATACFNLYAEELDDNNQPVASNLSTIKNYEVQLQAYFNQLNITKESFLGSVIWTNNLRYVVYSYLASLAYFETAVGDTEYDLTLSALSDDSTKPYLFKEWWGENGMYEAFILFENYMNLLNISANELRQKMGQEVAAAFSLSAMQITDCQGNTLCRNETKIPVEVTLITFYKVCFQLPFDRYPLQDRKQRLIVTANSHSLANKIAPDSDNYRLLTVYLLGKNDSEFNNRIYENGHLVYSRFDIETLDTVSVSAVYKSMVSMGKCSEYKTHETCLAECRIDLFRQMCNCTPTSWSSWASLESYPECRLNNYISCVNYGGNDDFSCVKENCGAQASPCERWIYDTRTVQNDYSSTGARIVLQAGSFDYPIFAQKYELSVEEFTGAVGGMIGFYLSLDFLDILLIISETVNFFGSLFTS